MKFPPACIALSLALTAGAQAWDVDTWLDQLDEALTVSAFGGAARVRLSGTFEMEAYHFSLPAPGFIDSQRHTLLNPRLVLFLDAQLGSSLYFFAQARVDRGFDPTDGVTEARLDEYALRWTPWEDGRLSIQAGKFATVVGAWGARHLAWDNPFINAPMAYENVFPISDYEAPEGREEFRTARVTPEEKYDYTGLVWGPVYATGASMAGKVGQFEAALELKNAGLSSRPRAWEAGEVGFQHPTVSGRLGWRPNESWNLGVSASRGTYLLPEVEGLPRGRSWGDYQQYVLGQDVSFAWHHWQLWAEAFAARYEVPNVGNADTLSYFLEARYKFTPELFGAVRWNQQFFGEVEGERWARDAWRVDLAVTYRLSAHMQVKLQYDVGRHDTDREGWGHMVGAQLMVRF